MPNSFLNTEAAKPKGKDSLFLWTVFLLFLAALVFACWLGSFYVFGHPEQARSYRILKKLGKIPPPTRFIVTKAPAGEFLEAQRLFERYSKYTALQMQRENELLFRNYLRNFSETKKLVPYLTGRFVILRAYELQRNDLMGSGVVALTQSVDFPQMLAEVLYSAPKENVPDMLALLQSGLELRLQRTLDLSAVIQVSHALDGRLQVTVVPLLYGSYALKNGTGMFSLEPPQNLNVGAGFPVVRGEEVRSVMRENLKRHNVAKGAQPLPLESRGEIVRVDGGGAPSESGETPSPGTTSSFSGAPGEKTQAEPRPGAGAAPAGAGASLNTAGTGDYPADTPPPSAVIGPTASEAATAKATPQRPEQRSEQKKDEGPARSVPEWMGKAEKILGLASNSPVAPAKKANSGDAQSGAATAVDKRPADKVPTDKVPEKTADKTAADKAVKPAAVPAAPSVAAQGGPKPNPKPDVSGRQEPVAAAGASAGAKVGQAPVAPETQRPPLAKPAPAAPPAQVVAHNPTAASPPVGGAPSGGAPLKPFVAAAPAPSTTVPTGTWKTYSAGKMPSGKSVTAEQATALQGRNDGAPVYLHGRFTVTAAGNNRAVLRQSASADGKPQPRVIVEYPAGAVPPKQGASVAKDDGRGFEIREVRRTPDGQVNIYVREVGGF